MIAHIRYHLMAALLMVVFTAELPIQASPITYQGRLQDNGSPANGNYDLNFRIWNSPSGGLLSIGNQLFENVPVTNGLFTVMLNLDGKLLKDGPLWLELHVRPNGSPDDYTLLSPRQELTSAPYAVMAEHVSGTVQADQLAGTLPPSVIPEGAITSAMLASGSVTSLHLATGAVTSQSLADGAVTADKLQTVTTVQKRVDVYNPYPADGDGFGMVVAPVGEAYFMVGARYDDEGATNAGSAYMFDLQGQLITTFTNPAPEEGDFFGRAIAAVGVDRVVIGAYQKNTGGIDTGTAYLFDLQGSLVMTYTNPAPSDFDHFGIGVTGVGNDHVLIGAGNEDQDGTDTGAAYLFDTAGTLVTTFINPAPSDFDNFGNEVAAVGTDRVLIGAHREDLGAMNAGVAYMFDLQGQLITTFTNPAPADNDFFGTRLSALGSNRVVVGVSRDDEGAEDAGSVYVFDLEGTLLTTITNPAPAVGDRFGTMAVLGSNRILVGARNDDVNGTDTGAVYLYDANGNLLLTFPNPTPASGEWFGFGLAGVGSGHVVIGARLDDTSAPDAGIAYLYNLLEVAPGLIAEGVAPASIDTWSLADGAVTSDKIAPGAVSQLGTPEGDDTGVVRVTDDGLVGIGTDQPDAGLHITGGEWRQNLSVFRSYVDEHSGYTNLNGAAELALDGDLLAVSGASDNGITLLDLSNINSPIRRSQFRNGDGVFTDLAGASGLDLSGSVLAIASFSSDAVTLVNVANPDSPTRYSLLRDGIGGFNELNAATDVAIEGNIMAVAAVSDSAVTLVDITNPAAPQLRGVIKDEFFGFNELNGAYRLAFSSNLLAVAAPNDDAVTLIDVSDPTNPVLKSVMKEGVAGFTYLDEVRDVSISGNLLAIAALRDDAVTLVDISDPANPVLLSVMVDGQEGFHYLNGASRTAFSGNTLAISGKHDDAVTLVDISNPMSPKILGAMINGLDGADVLDDPSGILFYNDFLVVAGEVSDSVSILWTIPSQVGLVSEGWVGVGKTTPLAPLHVIGDIVVDNAESILLDARHFSSGRNTIASGNYSTAMGSDTTASGEISTALGSGTTASGNYSTAMGNGTAASGSYSTALGSGTTASGNYSTAMGRITIASGDYSTALGRATTASGDYSTALGNNTLATNMAFAAGNRAKAQHEGSFVWGDSTDADVASSEEDQFVVRASGGVHLSDTTSLNFGNSYRQMINLQNTNYAIGVQADTFYSRSDSRFCWYRYGSHTDSGANPGPGGTKIMTLDGAGQLFTLAGMYPGSDRNIKTNFASVDIQEILSMVLALPIQSWNYTNDLASKHIGPMAQDFRAAFGLGPDDKHIATVDSDGVALAAIQGLNQKVEDRDQKLEARFRDLSAMNKDLEARSRKLETENVKLEQELTELKRLVHSLIRIDEGTEK